MAFTVSSNTPTSTEIQWANLHISYLGTSYTITNGHTNYAYVYWSPSSPTLLYVSNTFPTLGQNDCLLFLNKLGTAVIVPSSTVLDGDLIVPGSIVANAIAAGTITGDKIGAGEIDTVNLKADCIHAEQILANAVGADAIASRVITSDKIVAGDLTAYELNQSVGGAIDIAANPMMISANSTIGAVLNSLINDYTDSDLLSEMLAAINSDIAKYSIANWCTDNNLTLINGGHIATGSIEVESLNADNLSAISSDLGIVNTGVIRSADYDAGNGIELDFRDTTADGFSVKSGAKNTTLKIDADGTRVYNNSDLTTPVAEFVDTGVNTKKLVADVAVIGGLQITTVGTEVWMSSLL